MKGLLSILLALVLLPATAWAQGDPGWVAPYGIPAPGFGITASAGTTTITRTTAQAISDPIAAGSVILLDAGTHATSYTNAGILTCNGTSGSPIYIRGSGTLATTISGKLDIHGTYCVIENIVFTGGNTLITSVAGATDNIIFRHNRFTGNGVDDGGVTITSSGAGATTNVVLWDNIIEECGDTDFNGDQDCHGISLGSGNEMSSVWIVDNTISGSSGDGTQVNCGFTNPAIEDCHHFYLGRNSSSANRQSGLSVKGAVDVIFSQNNTFGNGVGAFASGCEPGLGYQYDHQYIWFLFNHSHDNCVGIRGASDDSGTRANVFIIGNLLEDNGPNSNAAGIHSNGNHDNDFFIAHNTILDTARSFWNNSGGAGTPIISSNILAGTVTSTGSPAWTITQRNNVTTQGASVDAGVSETPYATFLTRYGIDIQHDYNGVARPQDSVWDSGATEPTVGGGGPTFDLAHTYPWQLGVRP